MSKEHGEYGGVLVTQHFGGRDRGICLQLARYERRDARESVEWVTVTVDEAIELGQFMVKWAEEMKASYEQVLTSDDAIDSIKKIFEEDEPCESKDVIERVKEIVEKWSKDNEPTTTNLELYG
jgi:hypothetical protein